MKAAALPLHCCPGCIRAARTIKAEIDAANAKLSQPSQAMRLA